MPPILSRLTLALLVAGSATMALPAHAQISPTQASGNQQSERWTINLKDADLREFIDQIADITGETFVVDPRVKGQVTVVSRTPLSLSEVYQLFLSVMSTHGFSVITQESQTRIVPNAEAKVEGGDGRPAANRLETRVIQIQHGSASELIPLIRPLIPQFGHLAAVNSANALIISDRSANIARIEDLVRQLDQKGERDYTVLPLQHAWVMDTAEALNSAINRDQGQNKGAAYTQVIADGRTNKLIILGPPAARAKLVQLARSLDTPTNRSANTRVIRLRHNDAKSLAETLGQISEGLKTPTGGENQKAATTTTTQQNLLIRADESLNALVLLAEPDQVATLEDIVRQLDVPRAQVMVEAAIVEISGDISEALGVQWAYNSLGKNGKGGVGTINFSDTGLSASTVINAINSGQFPATLPDGAVIGIGSENFGALITALSSDSNSNLLSTPSLLTLDNQKAEILVGQNVPFQTGSYTTDASGSNNPFTTIERKDVGVTLKVTPHINEGGTLRLEIEQEISSIASSASLTAQAVDLVTNKRSIKSTILAENGQVIVLGGLIQDDVTRNNSKVPLLGDIPLLGHLFRSSKSTHVKRNLMVFLRPTVVLNAAGLAALSGKKYSDIRVLGGVQGERSHLLPEERGQLFEGSAIDLRRKEKNE